MVDAHQADCADRPPVTLHPSTGWPALGLCASDIGTTTRPPRRTRAAGGSVLSMIDLNLMMTELVGESGGGIASERGRAQVVVFEASEGNAPQDDEVKHYDADGAYASGDVWARYRVYALGFHQYRRR
jgi:hypothetical protein